MEQDSLSDLARSGLLPEDVKARQASEPDLASVKIPPKFKGYMLPYWDINGKPIQFYRVKLFGYELKYKQPVNTLNHVYFPRRFAELVQAQLQAGELKYVMLTEGEKKAACAVKNGIPCVALGGVDSYKNRTLILPADSEINPNYKEAGSLKVKLPSGETIGEEAVCAEGLAELSVLLLQHNIPLIIVYDTDSVKGTNFEVQRAAAGLGYQMAFLGLKTFMIRQLTLPFGSPEGKVGLDDFIMTNGADKLKEQIAEVLALPNAFPAHPNVRAMINSKLQTGKLSRKEVQEIALSVLCDLDQTGRRLRSDYDQAPFYFHKPSHTLMPASMLTKGSEALHEGVFGNHLYRTYGLSSPDTKIVSWLAAQFTGEDPISNVTPRKAITLTDDGIAVQISDSHFVTISDNLNKPFEILTNGSKGILFEQGHVGRIDEKELDRELQRQLKQPIECHWLDIFKNAVSFSSADGEKGMTLASMLYYLSPWLRRWNGMQLPVEILIGEPGSGKSSLYELRLGILNGNPMLRNLPQDMKDWYSSITSVGGLHVIDNVKFTDKQMRQRLSDEICRIITEPNPHIELRKLYTTSEVYRIPVNTVFAMTAIAMPFNANDIVQRSAIFKLNAVKEGHDAQWVHNQLVKRGGRVGWLAHHMVVIHKFLALAKKEWNTHYRSSHRLAHYEQSLILMAKVFGMETNWIPGELTLRMQTAMTEADWVLEALKEFVQHALNHHPNGTKFSTEVVVTWATASEAHYENQVLTNTRSLGKYMVDHATVLDKMLGIREAGMKGNKKVYSLEKRKE